MIIILTLIILSVFVIIYAIRREYGSPIFIFSALWSVVLLFYSLKLYGIYDISLNTELILSSGLLAFIFGVLFLEKIKLSPSKRISQETNYKKLLISFLVVLIMSLGFYIPNIIAVLKGTSLDTIKYMLVTGEIDFGGVGMQYIVRPFTYIIVAAATYCIHFERKKKMIIIIGALFTLMEFLGTGSKTIVLYFGVCLILPLLMNPDVKSKSLLKKFGFALIVMFLSVIMGVFRIYFYVCGCVPMLDKVINTSFYMQDGFAYGFVSFNSIVRLFIKTLSLVGVEIDSVLFERANTYITRYEYTTQVSSSGNFNAFHTFIGDFYVDFGGVGVVVLSLLFGMFSMYIYRLLRQHKNSMLWYISYCIILYYIVFGIVRFQMSNTFLGLMLVYSMTILKYLMYSTSLKMGKTRI